ncbi:uncharacterized protein DSM5745_11253 [Aspergillus mulundensis]|uniref:Zona occludens toxin N-terminal domain-containing protein n=1 Tax=Aspergillus mulundensis TaxID=1810919 RepID=A0A3D8Q9N9_9EURO|nr:Uncharacterized protein DSM5745_11253 [Aspergillus mulundensis]RDW58562.1 Uncharacterized protein DSM5745_11253 [Aspergillus mulundensis]
MERQKQARAAIRTAIRTEIQRLHQRNQRIDRAAIKAKYIAKRPEFAASIRATVDDNTANLLRTSRPPPPAVVRPASSESDELTSDDSSNESSEEGYDGTSTESSEDESDDNSQENSASTDESEPAENALLQDFKDDLANGIDMMKHMTVSEMPSLTQQQQLLSSDDEDEGVASIPASGNLDHSVLVSAMLESKGYKMPPQCGLLGKLRPAINESNGNADPRVVLNTNVPFSAFICGLQGSGKSHTTSCIIENCSMTMPMLGNLKRSVSTLVLHFNEYSSNINTQPSEAAFLASILPQYKSQAKPIPLRILVSPTNLHNLSKMYSQIPNVQVRPFKIHPGHLNISMMLSLMSMSEGSSMPLYMGQVLKVLREMAMESGGQFKYTEFRGRLDDLKLDRTQTPFLAQRLDLLDSYLDLRGASTGDYFTDGGVTILDLSCPFVDQGTACILFKIAIDLFLYAHPSRGKMIVADEAHKYMTDTPAAKELTETFLTIIRQQRHLGVRTVISTQEPTISPRLIDLCSMTIIHRFTSPKWYETIRSHLPIEKVNDNNEHGIPDGLYRIASLRTGEAIVFAPSAQLVDGDGVSLDTKHRTFRLAVRKRITWDGGRTILSIR